jgi:hypothetical protein
MFARPTGGEVARARGDDRDVGAELQQREHLVRAVLAAGAGHEHAAVVAIEQLQQLRLALVPVDLGRRA